MIERLIYEDNGRRLLVRMDGIEKSIPVPISLNHLALMEYQPDLDIEIILLFEKVVVFFRSNRLRTFKYQQFRLEEDLHIKTNRLNKARRFLKNAGILIESKPRRGEPIKFSVDISNIIASIPILYKLPEDESAKAAKTKEYETFFIYYLNKKYLREKIDPSVPDEVHTGSISLIAKDNSSDKNDDSQDNENYSAEIE